MQMLTMDDGSCSYPLSTVVSLPFDVTTTNCDMGNDVTNASTGFTLSYPESYYLGGEDAVYEFVGSGNPVDIVLTASEIYTGFIVFNGNPNEGGTVVSLMVEHLLQVLQVHVETTAGANYFVVVDSWPSPSVMTFHLCLSL